MTYKSTITITDDGNNIAFNIAHDPAPEGHRDTWHVPAKTADAMVRYFVESAKNSGLNPFLEASKNTKTGHINVTTRKEGPERR